MDILEWIEKAKSFSENDFLNDLSLKLTKDERIIDLQRQQWRSGKDHKGRIIGYYKKATEEISHGRKIQGDHYNLLDSGDFWERTYLVAKIKGNTLEFEFNSSGVNKKSLFETIQFHGEISDPEDIFGLMESYQRKLIDLIEPNLIKQIEKHYEYV